MTAKPAPLPEAIRRQMIAAHCLALCAWLDSLADTPQSVVPKAPATSAGATERRREMELPAPA